MAEKRYDKLIRDRIPEIIRVSGRQCVCRVMEQQEYLERLDQKLPEELNEYLESGSLEELADLTEVIHAVVRARGYTLTQLEQARADKARDRGGFEKRLLLEAVLDLEEMLE